MAPHPRTVQELPERVTVITATRKDVAQLAGTSPSVVSYVLNNGPRSVAPETRERVLAAVDQLDYRPNGIARSLRTRRTMTLGLIVPDNSNPFFAELSRAVEEASFDAGYTLLIGNATDDEDRQSRYVRTFLDRQVDGLVLIPAHAPETRLTALETAKVPWVVMDRPVQGHPEVPQVVVDNRNGGLEATGHLLEHGRRRIGCIAGPTDVAPTTARVDGWREALRDGHADLSESLLRHVRYGRSAGYHAALSLLRDEPAIDGLFATSDEQAVGALRAVAELGLRCPDDIAIASIDGIAASSYTVPALTTVVQPFGALAQTAIDLLLQMVNRTGDPHGTISLPAQLTARGSCGCPDPPGGASMTNHNQTTTTGNGDQQQ